MGGPAERARAQEDGVATRDELERRAVGHVAARVAARERDAAAHVLLELVRETAATAALGRFVVAAAAAAVVVAHGEAARDPLDRQVAHRVRAVGREPRLGERGVGDVGRDDLERDGREVRPQRALPRDREPVRLVPRGAAARPAPQHAAAAPRDALRKREEHPVDHARVHGRVAREAREVLVPASEEAREGEPAWG